MRTSLANCETIRCRCNRAPRASEKIRYRLLCCHHRDDSTVTVAKRCWKQSSAYQIYTSKQRDVLLYVTESTNKRYRRQNAMINCCQTGVYVRLLLLSRWTVSMYNPVYWWHVTGQWPLLMKLNRLLCGPQVGGRITVSAADRPSVRPSTPSRASDFFRTPLGLYKLLI